MPRQKQNLLGQRFGRLVVIDEAPNSANSSTLWCCKCDCGNEMITRAANLKSGHVKSCGCFRREVIAKRSTSHGGSNSRIYGIWRKMIARCENQKNENYRRYGARGVRVCAEWHDFTNFRDWAEKAGYTDMLSIDRIDVNGDYEPSNCRWADAKTQSNNRRSNNLITIGIETRTFAEWCAISGVKYKTAHRRLETGHTIEEVFSKGRLK